MTDNYPYESYEDWYDNGPGSEKFKREVEESRREFLREHEIIIRRKEKTDEKIQD
jgi:type II restriction/modification system DNA methylase subunit YeeA